MTVPKTIRARLFVPAFDDDGLPLDKPNSEELDLLFEYMCDCQGWPPVSNPRFVEHITEPKEGWCYDADLPYPCNLNGRD